MGMESHKAVPASVSLIGGGSAEPVWNQMFADIFNFPVVVFEDSDILPCIALSAAVLYGKKIISSYSQFISEILKDLKSAVYYPGKEMVKRYEGLYERFKKIYPAVRELF